MLGPRSEQRFESMTPRASSYFANDFFGCGGVAAAAFGSVGRTLLLDVAGDLFGYGSGVVGAHSFFVEEGVFEEFYFGGFA
mmetsp:Transcript_3157/g.5757  ORF Transcript_3157/g.5757 Transcript_3157/m.5757 type:complete len:81 (+) Transcript_3157:1209-1451(+)